MSNNHDFVIEFEIYRSFSCLWKKSNKDYHNTDKREEGYNALLAKFKEYEPGEPPKNGIRKDQQILTNENTHRFRPQWNRHRLYLQSITMVL